MLDPAAIQHQHAIWPRSANVGVGFFVASQVMDESNSVLTSRGGQDTCEA